MTFAEIAPWVAPSFLLALYSAIRAESLRKQARADDRWKTVELLEQRVTIAELRLNPLFQVMDKRLAAMFHEPHGRYWRSDALLERYWADPDEYRRSLTREEIEELIGYVFEWYQQTGKEGPLADAEKHFRAMQLLALLDGLKNVRRYLDEQEASETQYAEEVIGRSWWSWIKTWWRT